MKPDELMEFLSENELRNGEEATMDGEEDTMDGATTGESLTESTIGEQGRTTPGGRGRSIDSRFLIGSIFVVRVIWMLWLLIWQGSKVKSSDVLHETSFLFAISFVLWRSSLIDDLTMVLTTSFILLSPLIYSATSLLSTIIHEEQVIEKSYIFSTIFFSLFFSIFCFS